MLKSLERTDVPIVYPPEWQAAIEGEKAMSILPEGLQPKAKIIRNRLAWLVCRNMIEQFFTAQTSPTVVPHDNVESAGNRYQKTEYIAEGNGTQIRLSITSACSTGSKKEVAFTKLVYSDPAKNTPEVHMIIWSMYDGTIEVSQWGTQIPDSTNLDVIEQTCASILSGASNGSHTPGVHEVDTEG